MFSRALTDLAPWTESGMFENIDGPGFRDGYSDRDYTIAAIAKALLAKRIKEDETFDIKLFGVPEDANIDCMDLVLSEIAARATGGETELDELKNIVIISQVRNGGEERFSAVRKAIEDQVMPKHPTWKLHEKAEAFLNKNMKAMVLINEENASAFVVTSKLDMPRWHLIGSMFPAYIPKFFVDEPLNDKEKLCLKQLALHGADSFVSALAALEESYNIREQRIAAMIGGFEIRERESQIEIVNNEIDQILNQIQDLDNRYAELINRMDQANVRLTGLKYTREQTGDDDNLVKFFQSNKCLDVVEVSGPRITFIVRTYYDNFNPDEYESFRNNDRWYDEVKGNGQFSDFLNCRKVMDAMFISNKLRLKMCALFHLDIRGRVSTSTGYSFPPNCNDYVPNYHLDHHHCFGNYERVIVDYLRNGDTIGAINACIASAKSVNIAESSATFNPMMQEIFRSNKPCFELPDGTSVSPAKALEWLNEQEGAEQHEAD